jgi:hypothetical protein
MLPLNRALKRDWMSVFTTLVWASVIFIMGLSKMKSNAACGRAFFFFIIAFLWNMETMFSQYRWYKIYYASRSFLRKDAIAAFVFTVATIHGLPFWGVLLAHGAAAAWGAHLQPAGRIAALHAGNQITATQRNILLSGQAFGAFTGGVFYFLCHLFAEPEALDMAGGVVPWEAFAIEITTTLVLCALARTTGSEYLSVAILGSFATAGNLLGSSVGHALALNPPLFTGTLIYEVLRYGWSTKLVWMAVTTVAAWAGTLLPLKLMPAPARKTA